MKKWMYVIFPGLGLALFFAIYIPANARYNAGLESRAAAIAAAKAADEAHLHDIEERARQDSQKRAADNAKAEADKEAARIAKWKLQSDEIQHDTDGYNSDIAKYTKQVDELEKQLDELHTRKDQLTREDFDLMKEVELARVGQSNADLKIQRMVEMIATRAGGSSLTVQVEPQVPKK